MRLQQTLVDYRLQWPFLDKDISFGRPTVWAMPIENAEQGLIPAAETLHGEGAILILLAHLRQASFELRLPPLDSRQRSTMQGVDAKVLWGVLPPSLLQPG